MTKTGSKSKESQVCEYVKQATAAWDQAWKIYWDADNWVESHKTEDHVAVSYKKIRGLGKVFKLEAVLEATPAEVFDVLVTGVCDWPVWNPTILECQHVETLNENTDISYNLAAGQCGGLVSSRDFVNLRHWKSKDGVMMSSACAAKHPSIPVNKQHIRAENHPACYVFRPVADKPHQCQFACVLNTDLKGWLPQFLIDQAMTSVLLQYVEHLKKYLIEKRKQKPVREETQG